MACSARWDLGEPDATYYELRDEVRNLLRRSFPNPGDGVKIIEMFAASAEDDRLVRFRWGRDAWDAINYALPAVAILAAPVTS